MQHGGLTGHRGTSSPCASVPFPPPGPSAQPGSPDSAEQQPPISLAELSTGWATDTGAQQGL